MKVFTCTKFTGHYPVGVSAVVLSTSAGEASKRLNETLRCNGLPGDSIPENMNEIDVSVDMQCAFILQDGNY